MAHSYTGKGRAVRTPPTKDLFVRVRETWLICICTDLIVCVSWLIRGSGKGKAVQTPPINDFFVRARETWLIFNFPFLIFNRTCVMTYLYTCVSWLLHTQARARQSRHRPWRILSWVMTRISGGWRRSSETVLSHMNESYHTRISCMTKSCHI